MACLLLSNFKKMFRAFCGRVRKKKIAKEFILKHLEKNENDRAGDTLDGITKSWLEQTRIEIAVEEVAEALTDLVKKGLLRTRELNGIRIFFKNQPGKDSSGFK